MIISRRSEQKWAGGGEGKANFLFHWQPATTYLPNIPITANHTVFIVNHSLMTIQSFLLLLKPVNSFSVI